MDLSTLDAATEAAMQLRHPGTNVVLKQDDGRPITITLAGVDSERYRKAQRALTNQRLKMGGRRGGAGTLTAEELESAGLETLVACTVAWDGIILDGQALECNPANARTLYARLPWVRDQADEFMGERANFLTGSSQG